MFKKLFMLFKIGRKLSTSGAISSIYEIYDPPITIKILFFIIGFSFDDKKNNNNFSSGEKLCNALQGMGTTFIKLGQFLATRPDIIGEDIAKELEKLQDKLPPFQLEEAKNILKKEIGKENFDKIKNFSDSIAAASIAQVHFATINDSSEKKEVAIKILRPNIEKIFNEELDALLLLAYIVESLIKKTKRLKLVEVVQLLREITNVEMDLRFEAAAANELYENTKNDVGFKVPKIYWNQTSKKVLCLKKVDGWDVKKNKEEYYFLEKDFKFKNFLESQKFVNKVGNIAEAENHHPDIIFGWGYTKIKIFTHKIKGLVESDFILAAKINKILI